MTAFLVCALLCAAPPDGKDLTAIVTDRVVTGTGQVIENGVILIGKDGKIVRIAPRLPLPLGVKVIEAGTLSAYPGLVVARSTIGTDRSVRGGADTSVVEGLWPHGRTYDRVRAAGVTALGLAPSGGGLIQGQGAVVRPLERDVKEIVLGSSEFLVMGFTASQAQGLTAAFRQSAGPAARAAAGQMAVMISSGSATDTLFLVKALAPVRQRMRLSMMQEGDIVHALPTLTKARIPLIVPARLFTRPGTDYEYNVAAQVAGAGIPVVLLPVRDSVDAIETLRFDIALLIRSGLPEEVALRSVTLAAAQVLGIDWRIGSLEEGKDADLLLVDGDLFDPGAHIVHVFIAGEKVYSREASS